MPHHQLHPAHEGLLGDFRRTHTPRTRMATPPSTHNIARAHPRRVAGTPHVAIHGHATWHDHTTRLDFIT